MPIDFRTDANAPMAVVEVGRRGQLDSSHAAEVAQGILAAREAYPAAQIVLSVAGYDDDERELWDCPEVVDYMLHYSTRFSPNGATERCQRGACSLQDRGIIRAGSVLTTPSRP